MTSKNDRIEGKKLSASSLPALLEREDLVGGCRMFTCYTIHAGGGLPLVLVHGMGMSSRYLAPLARQLGRHFSVYVPDLPGYGRSQHPKHQPRLPELADTLVAWMDVMGLPQAAMVGNSMGCQTIVQLAVRHPSRLSTAVLMGPVIDPSGRSKLIQLLRGAWTLAMDEPISFWPVAFRDYLAHGPHNVMRELQWAIDYPIEVDLPKVRVPVLALRGERDRIVSRDWLLQVANCAPLGVAGEIPNAGHVTNYDSPEATALIIEAFLGKEAEGK